MCVYFCTQALDIQTMLSLLSPRFNDCYRAVDRELLTAAAPKHVDDLRNGTRGPGCQNTIYSTINKSALSPR